MDARHAAACRWASPTILLEEPFWLEAEDYPWSCTRRPLPQVLASTDACATCSFWEPHAGAAEPASVHTLRDRPAPQPLRDREPT